MRKGFVGRLAVAFVIVSLLLSAGVVYGGVQVGEEVHETHETPHPYAYEATGVVWEQTFHWPRASYINIHFTEFDLAPGDYVEISSPDGKYKYRYEGKGKVVRGGKVTLAEFWASHISGDTAIVRFYNTSAEGAQGFKIDKWARGYESEVINDLFNMAEEISPKDICGDDDKEWAPCYDGTTIYEKSRPVARLLMNNKKEACTGWLLGSEGHLMTNNHCIENQTDADNTDYEFMAEGAECTTDCSGGMSCPGTVEATSGTLVRTDYELDYSLILLPTNLTPTYGYLQLRSTMPDIGERIYIPQHPKAKGKQIAVNDDQTGGYCEVHSADEPGCDARPGPDIGYICDTERGSSGSPVIAYCDDLVVGLHHCLGCPNRSVPIPSIITHLGGDLPADAVGCSSTTCAPNDYCNAQETINTVSLEDVVEDAGFTSDSTYSEGARLGARFSEFSSANNNILGENGKPTTIGKGLEKETEALLEKFLDKATIRPFPYVYAPSYGQQVLKIFGGYVGSGSKFLAGVPVVVGYNAKGHPIFEKVILFLRYYFKMLPEDSYWVIFARLYSGETIPVVAANNGDKRIYGIDFDCKNIFLMYVDQLSGINAIIQLSPKR